MRLKIRYIRVYLKWIVMEDYCYKSMATVFSIRFHLALGRFDHRLFFVVKSSLMNSREKASTMVLQIFKLR